MTFSDPRVDDGSGQRELVLHRGVHVGDVSQDLCPEEVLLHGALERLWLYRRFGNVFTGNHDNIFNENDVDVFNGYDVNVYNGNDVDVFTGNHVDVFNENGRRF